MKKQQSILFLCLIFILASCSLSKPLVSSSSLNPSLTVGASSTPVVTATTTAIPTAISTETTPIPETPMVTPTAENTDEIHYLTGVFQSIEWGDYLHMNIKDEDGVDFSFFVLTDTGVDPESLNSGQKIKVTWQNSDEFLDPPGETVNLDKIITIELVK